jgi:hypothetical protein
MSTIWLSHTTVAHCSYRCVPSHTSAAARKVVRPCCRAIVSNAGQDAAAGMCVHSCQCMHCPLAASHVPWPSHIGVPLHHE